MSRVRAKARRLVAADRPDGLEHRRGTDQAVQLAQTGSELAPAGLVAHVERVGLVPLAREGGQRGTQIFGTAGDQHQPRAAFGERVGDRGAYAPRAARDRDAPSLHRAIASRMPAYGPPA